jgi:hypothetical protein
MKEIGRVLKMDWGSKVVSIAIYFKTPKEMNIPKEGRLFKIFEFDGEVIEKDVGIPGEKVWGYSLNQIIDEKKLAFLTKKEVEELK